MQETLDKLLDEVTYNVGKVVSDPQTWSDTKVHGGGYVGGRHGGSVSISSSSVTWTSFVIQKENGKEYMAKLSYAFPARKGNAVIAADFRDATIAAANDATDELQGTLNVVRRVLKDEDKEVTRNATEKWMQILSIGAPLALALLFTAIDSADFSVLVLVFIFWLFMNWLLVTVPKNKREEKKVDFIDANLPKAACENMKTMMANHRPNPSSLL